MGIYASTGHCIVANTEDKKNYVCKQNQNSKNIQNFIFLKKQGYTKYGAQFTGIAPRHALLEQKGAAQRRLACTNSTWKCVGIAQNATPV